jgi:hypothetical protein
MKMQRCIVCSIVGICNNVTTVEGTMYSRTRRCLSIFKKSWNVRQEETYGSQKQK